MPQLAEELGLIRRNGHFRRLWIAELLSIFGDWFNTIALYTAAEQLIGTSEAVGLVLIAKSLPVLLVSPIAGSLVDRFSRRRLMVIADLGRALAVGGLIAAYHYESELLLYAGMVVSTSFSGLFLPARSAAVPMLVEGKELPVANAILGATWSATLAFGAAAGGFATHLLGVSAALWLDIGSYLVSAGLIATLPPLTPRSAKTEQDSGDAGFLAGIAHLRRHPDQLVLTLQKSGMAFTSGAMPLLSEYGNHLLSDRAAPQLVGLLFASRGLGAGIGSIYGRVWFGESDRAFRFAIGLGFLILGLAYGLLSGADTLLQCCLLLVLGGFGNALIWVPSSVLLQQRVPRAFQGRVFALEFGIMTAVFAVAILAVTGPVDRGAITVRDAMLYCGLASLLPMTCWLLWNRRPGRSS